MLSTIRWHCGYIIYSCHSQKADKGKINITFSAAGYERMEKYKYCGKNTSTKYDPDGFR
jgi:hypothetical protein